MIENRDDYRFYLRADYFALSRDKMLANHGFLTRFAYVLFADEVWKFQKALRKTEYLQNTQHGLIGKIRYGLAYLAYRRLSIRYGLIIRPNNFGPGLCIGHTGSIIVNETARIGANCHIHPGVVIGTQAGHSNKSPRIGDNVHIGPGAKVFGEIEIADNIAIGANAVVTKSFTEPGISIGGVPARKISAHGSEGYLTKGTELAKKQR